MSKKFLHPIISLSSDRSLKPEVILQDGNRAPLSEDNINAIIEQLESGLVERVSVTFPNEDSDDLIHPIEIVETAYNADEFRSILPKDNSTVCKPQTEPIPLQSPLQNAKVSQNPVSSTIVSNFKPFEHCDNGMKLQQIYKDDVNRNVAINTNAIRASEIINANKAIHQLNISKSEVMKSEEIEKERFNAADGVKKILSKKILVVYNKAVYEYVGTHYSLRDADDLNRMVREVLKSETDIKGSFAFIKDITRHISTDAPKVNFDFSFIGNRVMFKNGVFNLDTYGLEPHSIHFCNTHALAVPYLNCDIPTPIFDRYIYDMACGDMTLVKRIWETLGYLISNDTKAKRIVLFIGSGNTGKSLFGKIVEKMFDCGGVSACSIDDLKNNFIGTRLVNSAVNICMDLPSSTIDSSASAMLKRLSGGDLINGEIKYMSNFEYVYTGHLLFGSNYLLKLNYNDPALAERLLIIPCINPIPKEQQDPYLCEKITANELSAIASKAVHFFGAVRKNNYIFTGDDKYNVASEDLYIKSAISVAITNNDENESNTHKCCHDNIDAGVSAFANAKCLVTDDWDDYAEASVLHNSYKAFCFKNNFSAIAKCSVFTRKLHEVLPKIEGNKKREGSGTSNVWHYLILVD